MSFLWMTNSLAGSWARASALRGKSSMRAISPKCVPARRTASASSPAPGSWRPMRTAPDKIRYILSPCSPSLKIRASASYDSSTPRLAIRRK